MIAVLVLEIKVADATNVVSIQPLQATYRRNKAGILSGIKLSHSDHPSPGGCCSGLEADVEDDLVAVVAGLHVHVLPGVVAADDGRGGAARGGHRHRVVNAVSYERAVTGGTGNGARARPTGERLGDVELVKIKSQQDHVLVCSADLVNTLKNKIKSIFDILLIRHFPVPK